jgi:hypothetical protein
MRRRSKQEMDQEIVKTPVTVLDSRFTVLRKRMVQQVADGTELLLQLQKLRRFILVHLWLRGSSALGGETRVFRLRSGGTN